MSELTSPLTVLVVGQGNVGLPLAMRSVEVGHRVVGFDTDARRIRRLGAGDSYVEEWRRPTWPARSPRDATSRPVTSPTAPSSTSR